MKFKYLYCPVCGKQLINLKTMEAQERGFHEF